MKNKLNQTPQIVFLRGPLCSNKSTWFKNNFPLNWGDNIVWIWKTAQIREHWRDWWEKNQIYWRRLSNDHDAFWNPRHRAPEVWMVRVRRPDWFWGKSASISQSGRLDHSILTDCSKCIQTLIDQFPEGPLRMLCWVIDDPFWNRIEEKWNNFPLLKSCPFYVRPSDIAYTNQEDIMKTLRLGGAINDRFANKIDVWEIKNWELYGWVFHGVSPNETNKSENNPGNDDDTEESGRIRKLPVPLQWKEQVLLWLH